MIQLGDKGIKDKQINEKMAYSSHGILDIGHRVNLQNIRKEEEYKLRQRLYRIKRNLKHIAHIYLAFSIFLVLNDCVGLSSAPFYISSVQCNLMEPSPECKTLKNLASGAYISEMIGAFFLAFQTTLIYYFIDNYTGGSSTSSSPSNSHNQ